MTGLGLNPGRKVDREVPCISTRWDMSDVRHAICQGQNYSRWRRCWLRFLLQQKKMKKSLRDDHEKIRDYWEDTVPQYTEKRFRRAFRLPRSVFDYVLDKLKDNLSDLFPAGRPSIPADKKIAIFLKYSGSKETILDLAQLFGVTEATVIKSRRQVAQAIINVLMEQHVVWPHPTEYPTISEAFQVKDLTNFPGIIGCLDGSHVPIGKPHSDKNPDAFYNRKKFFSKILQAVCREDLRFTDICVGLPGRMHDARVLRTSDLWNTGHNKTLQGQYHLLADAAYPLCRWLLTPYRNTGLLSPEQRRYNVALSTRRVDIERAFGVLKRRFRRLLLGIDIVDLEEIDSFIMAVCILHNVCMLYDEEIDFVDEEDIQDNLNFPLDPLFDALPNEFNVDQGVEGRIKRITITNNL